MAITRAEIRLIFFINFLPFCPVLRSFALACCRLLFLRINAVMERSMPVCSGPFPCLRLKPFPAAFHSTIINARHKRRTFVSAAVLPPCCPALFRLSYRNNVHVVSRHKRRTVFRRLSARCPGKARAGSPPVCAAYPGFKNGTSGFVEIRGHHLTSFLRASAGSAGRDLLTIIYVSIHAIYADAILRRPGLTGSGFSSFTVSWQCRECGSSVLHRFGNIRIASVHRGTFLIRFIIRHHASQQTSKC